ncbi:hypothetical protein PMIT1320_01278 [Prochlorococcus marinus str. MIT 1320]|nr:hypothetical protein PMIT1320_01278 [Prochlorococcus marinus str. MIT 1320]
MNRLVVKGDKNVLPSRTLFFALGKNPATGTIKVRFLPPCLAKLGFALIYKDQQGVGLSVNI